MMERDAASRYKANLEGELDSASLYRALADSEMLIAMAATITFGAGRLVGALDFRLRR
jgi:hypothetical protein